MISELFICIGIGIAVMMAILMAMGLIYRDWATQNWQVRRICIIFAAAVGFVTALFLRQHMDLSSWLAGRIAAIGGGLVLGFLWWLRRKMGRRK